MDPDHAQEGILNGTKVRVKRVRKYSNEDLRTAKVCQRPHYIPHSPVLTKSPGLQPISCGVETVGPPKYCSPSGRYYRSSAARF